jgi:hypothetical protein
LCRSSMLQSRVSKVFMMIAEKLRDHSDAHALFSHTCRPLG